MYGIEFGDGAMILIGNDERGTDSSATAVVREFTGSDVVLHVMKKRIVLWQQTGIQPLVHRDTILPRALLGESRKVFIR
jgi:hypothetical protein